MNILIPHSWLLEHLDTAATPQQIQEYLSLSGPSVERIYDREGESVYDIEITTNRVDSMSVRGVAREAAVILTQFGVPAQLKPEAIPEIPTPASSLPLPKIINDPALCPRILCVVLRDVKRSETPEWMAKRLRQIDQQVHDSVIDITNYITHELGHSCHAFDYDQVMALGGEIHVVTAEPGMSFTTLDNESYKTVGGEVVFVNDKNEIIDLPAIKGTANTSINQSTKNVLLWIESMDAKKVRFTSMTHAIRTVAAQLNERSVDPVLAEAVLQRGVELYQQLCGAIVASPVYDEFPGKQVLEPVTASWNVFQNYLGVELPHTTISSILEQLGCEVQLEDEVIIVKPPTFRPDLVIPADLVEEIARIYGYHRLPSVIMPTAIPVIKPADTNFQLEHRLQRFLADLGWQETYTYAMVSAEIATKSGYALSDHLKIQNPLADDRVYMRRSLIPSLEEMIENNTHQALLSVFELAYVYEPRPNDVPLHHSQLSLVSANEYRWLRGMIEALLAQVFLTNVTVKTQPAPSGLYHQWGELQVEIDGGVITLGTIGVLPSGKTAATIDMATLITHARSHPAYEPIANTSVIIEDLTFTLPKQTEVGPLLHSIKALNNLVVDVVLLSVYKQNITVTIKYHTPDRSVTVEEITPLRKEIVEMVNNKFKGQLVGQV